MLSELQSRNRIVGVKQLRKSLREGSVIKVFAAADADPRLLEPILNSCSESGIPVEEAASMKELGKACGIEVGAAAAALLRE